jgi:hypothetical protein
VSVLARWRTRARTRTLLAMPSTVPAVAVTDREWLGDQLDATARLFGRTERRTLGVLWWYSASSVLIAASVSTLVHSGRVADPDLGNLTLHRLDDGRLVRAVATGFLADHSGPAELGRRLGPTLATAIGSVAAVSGARTRPLWAIASDALANGLLMAGTEIGRVDEATAMAVPIAAAVGDHLPRPRYVDVAGRRFVRRGSCCLIYLATGGEKCISCPRQHPDQRHTRLRRLVTGS